MTRTNNGTEELVPGMRQLGWCLRSFRKQTQLYCYCATVEIGPKPALNYACYWPARVSIIPNCFEGHASFCSSDPLSSSSSLPSLLPLLHLKPPEAHSVTNILLCFRVQIPIVNISLDFLIMPQKASAASDLASSEYTLVV